MSKEYTILFNACNSYKIKEDEISIISDLTCYGRNTVAQINKETFHHLGDEIPGIAAAIYAWQEHYKKDLSIDELSFIMKENNIIK